ncbi:xanthine dehydrogenase molybdopterin binding subunit [Telmatospirillum sp. J64-1]|uniref:xanthine dehydrogenase molybdopterin binding subunit n=1 Tax=Telmatospirillum sp. J64-1 TaxID=2502183 RepID=UPI00115EAC23|nr:xanthine dehydrogenase molybdopterin binding subunit [Telmatospirillum sp. J64-1]
MSVHQSKAHDSAVKHVTGEAQYIDDMPEPRGLLHAHLVTSPVAHGRLLSIDTTPALAVPGVAAVVTAADIPGKNDIGSILKGEPVFAEDLVAYVGHPIGAAAALTPEAARAGAKAVKAEIETLKPILTIEDALTAESYVMAPMEMKRGDAAAAIAAAPLSLDGEVMVGGQDHFYLETQVAMALPQEDGDMLVLSSTQHPTEVQHMVAKVLALPYNAVTVEVRRMGGGFGGKESQASLIACIAAILARKTRRPVKLRLDRDDDMMVTGKRHDFLIRWRAGFDETGLLHGVEMTLASRCGWSADLSPPVMSRALSHADNAYYYPAAHFKGFGCRTNTQSNTAFRGFGAPQGMIAAEAMIETIARHLGQDPLELRKRNLYRPGRDRTPYGQKVENFRLPTMIEQITAKTDFAARRAQIRAFNSQSPIIKRGLALAPVKFGVSFNNVMMNQAGALLHVYTDGSIHLNHGGTEMGQGLFVKVAQVVAEVFQVPLDSIKITATTTGKVPNTSPTAASSGTDLNGMAARNAAMAVRNRLVEFIAEHCHGKPEDVVFSDGRVRIGNHDMSFAQVARMAHAARVSLSATGFYKTPHIHFDGKSMTGRPFYYYANGVSVSEVSLDTLTGEWRLERVDILHDVGASLNPAIDKGQVEGGFVQGMGWLTMEELVWDEQGRLLTHAPSTYKIPTARDVPRAFFVDLLENAPNEEMTIYRSKAVGEPPLMLAMSVWLALLDAVAATAAPGKVPRLDAPATPERLLMAVKRASEAA